MPGTAGTFVFTTDTFGLPRGVRNRAGALELLGMFGSLAGQDTFNPLKGSIPARKDARVDAYDIMAQRNIMDFRQVAADPTMLVPATAMLAPPEFIDALAFRSAGDSPLLRAVDLLRQLNAEHRRVLPDEASLDFVPARWRPYVIDNPIEAPAR